MDPGEFVTPVKIMRLKLISCEVFYREMCAVLARSPNEVDVEFLSKGLHSLNSSSMLERIPGLHHGEAEILSVAISRSMPAVIFERRARRVARMLGADLIDVTELIVAGTTDRALMEDRIVRFARMVNMRFDHVTELLSRIGSRRII